MDMNLDYNTACNAYENEDYKTAFELFFKLAKEGDVSSQMNIANMLLHGIGVEKDEEKAYECYLQAADNGDDEAQYYYGWHCLKTENESKGLKYLNLAEEQAHNDATYDLAGIYAHGMYKCELDLDKACKLYEKSIGNGKEDAVKGLMYARSKRDGRFKTLIYFMKNISKFRIGKKA